MKTLILSRFDSSSEGMFSHLSCENLSLFATERPWLDNQKQVSCIPTGTYEVRWHKSAKFGLCYKVFDVPNRDAILIHPGNFYWHSHGCILPAIKLGYIEGKKAGLMSYPAVQKLNDFFNKESFLLEIRDDCNYLGLVK